MSEERIRLIRTGHTEVGGGVCGLDGDDWPCDTAVVLLAYMNDLRDLLPKSDQLAAAESARAALEAPMSTLADATEGLLNHFYRHTTHRCEIDREAEGALADVRALLASPASGSSSAGEGEAG